MKFDLYPFDKQVKACAILLALMQINAMKSYVLIVFSIMLHLCYWMLSLWQICRFQLGTNTYDSRNVFLKTVLPSPNELGHNKHLYTYTILDYSTDIRQLNDEDTLLSFSNFGSNWTVSGFEIHLERQVAKYIVQCYITSGMLVLVSWVRNCKGISVYW